MIKLIKMDSYRMLKSRSTYVIFGLFLLFILFLAQNIQFNYDSWQHDIPLNNALFGFNYVQSLFQPLMTVRNIFDLFISSRTVLVFLALFTFFFVKREKEVQFTKVVTGYFSDKSLFVFSKFFCQILFLLGLLMMLLLISCLVGPLIFPHYQNQFTVTFWFDFGLQFLFHLAFATILLSLFTWIKQPMISLLLALYLCLGGMDYLSSVIFPFSNYSLTKMIQTVTASSSHIVIKQSVSLAIFIILIIVSGLYLQQRSKRVGIKSKRSK